MTLRVRQPVIAVIGGTITTIYLFQSFGRGVGRGIARGIA